MNTMMQRIELNKEINNENTMMMQRIELNKENTMNTMMQRIELFDTNAHLVGNSSDSDSDSDIESESESETLTSRDDNDSFAFSTVTSPRRQIFRKRHSICTGRIEGSAFRPMVPSPKRLCRSPKVFSQGNLSKWQKNLQSAKEVTTTTTTTTLEDDTTEWWFKARRGESFDGNSSGSDSNFCDEVDEMVGNLERHDTAMLDYTKIDGDSERNATAL